MAIESFEHKGFMPSDAVDTKPAIPARVLTLLIALPG
jgi:hypothetical protein